MQQVFLSLFVDDPGRFQRIDDLNVSRNANENDQKRGKDFKDEIGVFLPAPPVKIGDESGFQKQVRKQNEREEADQITGEVQRIHDGKRLQDSFVEKEQKDEIEEQKNDVQSFHI